MMKSWSSAAAGIRILEFNRKKSFWPDPTHFAVHIDNDPRLLRIVVQKTQQFKSISFRELAFESHIVPSSQSSETILIGLSYVLREEHQNDLAGPMIEREQIVASVYTLNLPGQGLNPWP